MPSRNRIENEKPNAIAGAATPFVGEHTVRCDQPLADVGDVAPDVGQRRAVADVVAHRCELELGVEHLVRIPQAHRDLHELVVVQVGGAGEPVRALAVAVLDGLERSGPPAPTPCRSPRARAPGRSAPPRRVRAAASSDRAAEDRCEQRAHGYPCELALRRGEIRLELVHLVGDLARRRLADVPAQVGGDAFLELLVQLRGRPSRAAPRPPRSAAGRSRRRSPWRPCVAVFAAG